MTTATHPTDAQIAQSATLLPIYEIGKTLGLSERDLIPYGHTKVNDCTTTLTFDKKASKSPDFEFLD